MLVFQLTNNQFDQFVQEFFGKEVTVLTFVVLFPSIGVFDVQVFEVDVELVEDHYDVLVVLVINVDKTLVKT